MDIRKWATESIWADQIWPHSSSSTGTPWSKQGNQCGSRCFILWPRWGNSSTPTWQLLAASIIYIASDDAHWNQICTNRKGSPSAHMGMWTILGVHCWKINLCGKRPQTPGATLEYSHTGSTPTRNSKIQNATDEISLQGDQACSRKEDVHSWSAFKTPNPKPNSDVNNWPWGNECAHCKRDLVTACLRHTITADHGSTGGGSGLQADQSILLWRLAWQEFIKWCNETLLVKQGWTVCGTEHSAQSIQDRNPFFYTSWDTG